MPNEIDGSARGYFRCGLRGPGGPRDGLGCPRDVCLARLSARD